MTKDTEPLQDALTAHYPTGEWMQPCGNHVLCCSCNENLWGVDRDACKAAWRMHVIEALSTPASAELGFDPTAEVGDEVFPHDTIGSHFGNGGGLDPAAGGDVAPGTRTVCERCGKAGLFFCDHVSRYNDVHPPLAQSVDPVAGEALREVAAKYADMGIDERAEAMADNCDGDPWELIGYFREKLRQSQARVDTANNAATGFAKKLAALKGPAA